MGKYIERFISLEAASGLLLLLVLCVALIIANSPFASIYHTIIDVPIQIRIGQLDVHKSALLWVNEGLMAIFFLLLALEMKREIVTGELAQPKNLVLPLCSAIGGIVFPVAVYFAINAAYPDAWIGWPIATTTDIAFAVGILALISRHVPVSLKIFLVALSIVDDILAVTIIAIFYTDQLTMLSLMLGLLGVIGLIVLNLTGVTRIAPYMLVGIFIWVCVLKSGVHATLAGVAIGATIPIHVSRLKDNDKPPLVRLEHMLHPWVAFMILPLFVFMNGGILFKGVTLSSLMSHVPIGIALGLAVGKTLGVFLIAWVLIKLKFAKMPSGANWLQVFAISAITGIGFTMSLFLSALAFYGTSYEELARQGVLMGSLVSCLVAISCFLLATKLKQRRRHCCD